MHRLWRATMLLYTAAVLQALITAVWTDCTCFDVDVMATDVADLIKDSPMYGFASTATDDVDSVCALYTGTHTPDNALLEQVITYSNNSIVQKAGVLKSIKSGSFQYGGPEEMAKEFVIDKPCPTTYVVYRCKQGGSCVTMKSKASVYISSKNKDENEQCITDGITKATKLFPGIKFVKRNRTSTTPCKPVGFPPTPATPAAPAKGFSSLFNFFS